MTTQNINNNTTETQTTGENTMTVMNIDTFKSVLDHLDYIPVTVHKEHSNPRRARRQLATMVGGDMISYGFWACNKALQTVIGKTAFHLGVAYSETNKIAEASDAEKDQHKINAEVNTQRAQQLKALFDIIWNKRAELMLAENIVIKADADATEKEREQQKYMVKAFESFKVDEAGLRAEADKIHVNTDAIEERIKIEKDKKAYIDKLMATIEPTEPTVDDMMLLANKIAVIIEDYLDKNLLNKNKFFAQGRSDLAEEAEMRSERLDLAADNIDKILSQFEPEVEEETAEAA